MAAPTLSRRSYKAVARSGRRGRGVLEATGPAAASDLQQVTDELLRQRGRPLLQRRVSVQRVGGDGHSGRPERALTGPGRQSGARGGGRWHWSLLSLCPGGAAHASRRGSYVPSTGILDHTAPRRTAAESIEPGQSRSGAPRRIRTCDLPLRGSFRRRPSTAACLTRAGLLGLWPQLDVSGFCLVRARRGHGHTPVAMTLCLQNPHRASRAIRGLG